MVYEVYVEDLFLENLIWNICLLWLVNTCFWKTAGHLRMAAGAFLGAFWYIAVLLIPMPALLKRGLILLGSILMLPLTFSVKGAGNYVKVLGAWMKYGILLGGGVLFLRHLPGADRWERRMLPGLLLLETLTVMVYGGIRRGQKRGTMEGYAVLIRGKERVRVRVIVDSGNSLTEPVSGKPVCVLDPETAGLLWGDMDYYRVIPYRSVGMEKGIMRGYLLPQLALEVGGPVKVIKNVFVAASPQELTKEGKKIQMLIHPVLLTGGKDF